MTHGIRTTALTLALVLAAQAVAAQSITAPGWRAGVAPADREDAKALPDSAFNFTMMPPGWHIITGPPATFSEPSVRADGRFAVESELFVFPGSGGDEGLGLVVGGRSLASGNGRGLAFLIRRDGAASVVRLAGERRTVLVDWTPNPHVAKQAGSDIVKNVLRVDVEADSLRFRVNGAPVTAVARAGLEADGEVGFHVGRGHSIHVTTLDIARKYAPPRQPRPTS